jgi:hypothetical protein
MEKGHVPISGLEDIERKIRRLIEKIEAVDDLASDISGRIQLLHERGFKVEAERLRQVLAVWHIFGQMSAEGPII